MLMPAIASNGSRSGFLELLIRKLFIYFFYLNIFIALQTADERPQVALHQVRNTGPVADPGHLVRGGDFLVSEGQFLGFTWAKKAHF